MKKVREGKEAWQVPKYTIDKVTALKALYEGNASERQQKLALDFIINEICNTNDWAYDPDSEENTYIALGKQFAGLSIRRFITLPTTKLKEMLDGTSRTSSGDNRGSTKTRRASTD
jgi:hypothetical protein